MNFAHSTDGDYSARALVEPTQKSFPFLNWPTKDDETALFSRLYEIDRASYAPFDALDTLPDDGADDAADAGAYLFSEGAAQYAEDGTQRWRCIFGHIPPPQARTIEQYLTKPTPQSQGAIGYAGQPAGNLFYSSADTSVQTANAFAHLGYLWANNKVWGPIAGCTSVNDGANTRLTKTAHGIAGTEQIVVWYTPGGSFRWHTFGPAQYTVVDANTIDLLGVNWGGEVDALARFYRDYMPGTDLVRFRETWNFYLPGAAGQPATEDDIPAIATAVNDAALLALIVAHTSGYQVYDAEPLDNNWPFVDSPVFRRITREIDMASL